MIILVIDITLLFFVFAETIDFDGPNNLGVDDDDEGEYSVLSALHIFLVD